MIEMTKSLGLSSSKEVGLGQEIKTRTDLLSRKTASEPVVVQTKLAHEVMGKPHEAWLVLFELPLSEIFVLTSHREFLVLRGLILR
eukprot:scaffold13631_cov38-Cyclotella_meneghiniana.AAC.20